MLKVVSSVQSKRFIGCSGYNGVRGTGCQKGLRFEEGAFGLVGGAFVLWLEFTRRTCLMHWPMITILGGEETRILQVSRTEQNEILGYVEKKKMTNAMATGSRSIHGAVCGLSLKKKKLLTPKSW